MSKDKDELSRIKEISNAFIRDLKYEVEDINRLINDAESPCQVFMFLTRVQLFYSTRIKDFIIASFGTEDERNIIRMFSINSSLIIKEMQVEK